jgi:hypothetical protein
MSSDIAERGGAKQRIADGVTQYVRVRVTHEALLERDLNPSKDELAPLDQSMNVISDPRPRRAHLLISPSLTS